MRDYLAPVLAAIQTPPHMPKQAFEEARQNFSRLENYFQGVYGTGRQVSQTLEEITGHRFQDPIRELPLHMRNLVEYLGTDKRHWENPISEKIDTLLKFMQFKNPSMETIGLMLKALVRVEHEPGEYGDFWGEYTNFIKEYPEMIQELHSIYHDAEKNGQLDDYWKTRLTAASDQLQTYRSALDAVYKYISLYLKFARQVDAYILRRNMQLEAYYFGGAYPERTQRPPHKPVEVLYHAGTDVTAILAEGFKTRAELGEGKAALGGGPEDVISFTADIQIARAIADALRYVVRIARGEVSFSDVLELARQDGVPAEKFDTVKRDYRDDPRRLAYEAYRVLLWFSDKRYDPVFFGVRIENFETVRPEAIGILAAKVKMDQVTEYLREMEEFRAPKSAVLSMKRVPY